jgi:hypothetical protein
MIHRFITLCISVSTYNSSFNNIQISVDKKVYKLWQLVYKTFFDVDEKMPKIAVFSKNKYHKIYYSRGSQMVYEDAKHI